MGFNFKGYYTAWLGVQGPLIMGKGLGSILFRV